MWFTLLRTKLLVRIFDISYLKYYYNFWVLKFSNVIDEGFPQIMLTDFETGSSSLPGNIHGKSLIVAKNHLPEVSPSSTVLHGSNSHSRPSSNYSNRSQQAISLQKGNSYV